MHPSSHSALRSLLASRYLKRDSDIGPESRGLWGWSQTVMARSPGPAQPRVWRCPSPPGRPWTGTWWCAAMPACRPWPWRASSTQTLGSISAPPATPSARTPSPCTSKCNVRKTVGRQGAGRAVQLPGPGPWWLAPGHFRAVSPRHPFTPSPGFLPVCVSPCAAHGRGPRSLLSPGTSSASRRDQLPGAKRQSGGRGHDRGSLPESCRPSLQMPPSFRALWLCTLGRATRWTSPARCLPTPVPQSRGSETASCCQAPTTATSRSTTPRPPATWRWDVGAAGRVEEAPFEDGQAAGHS